MARVDQKLAHGMALAFSRSELECALELQAETIRGQTLMDRFVIELNRQLADAIHFEAISAQASILKSFKSISYGAD